MLRQMPALIGLSVACVSMLACRDNGLHVQDADKDGHTALTDCNDQDASIHPNAEEVCDGIDNNCDMQVDEGVSMTLYADIDGDTFGDPDASDNLCEEAEGYVADNTDCDDDNDTIYPDAPELCDELDNDCDTEVDEDLDQTYYRDQDEDTYGNADDTVVDCAPPEGYVADNTDCADDDDTIHPNANEICDDEIDQDCDGFDAQCNIDDWMDLDSDADMVIRGNSTSLTGNEVSLINDMDGDGRAEVVIASSNWKDAGGTKSGLVTVIDFNEGASYRGILELHEEDDDHDYWVFEPEAGGDILGSSVASAGDLDGDGAPDLIIGAAQKNTEVGAAYIFRASQIAASPGVYNAADASAVLNGAQWGYTGASVAAAGDVNNDGFDDLVVGASRVTNSGSNNVGRAYIIFGCEEGLGDCDSNSTGHDVNYLWDSGSSGQSISDIADSEIAGPNSDARLGSTVAGGGDFNADGYDDVLLGAYQADSPYDEGGIAYLVTDFPSVSNEAESAASVIIRGESYHDGLGAGLDFAGDVNGDGYDDLLLGAPNADNWVGAAYLVLGQIDDLDLKAGSAETKFTSEGYLYATGQTVAGLGDLDGDGKDEFSISATKAIGTSGSVEGAGRVYIFRDLVSGTVTVVSTV